FIVGGAAVAVVAVVALAVNLHSAKPKTSARVSEGPKRNASPAALDAGTALAQASPPAPSSASPAPPEGNPAAAPESETQWIEVKVERHKRPKIADVRAPANGQLRWKAASRHVVRSGEVLGNVREKRGGKERAVLSPKDGVFVPKALQGAKTRKM